MRRLLFLAALAAAMAAPAAGFADGVAITQSVAQSRTVDVAAVEHLPAVELNISFATEHGQEHARYTGALLWDVLGGAKDLGANPRARLRRSVVVTGSDGYTALLALAEIDPAFEAKQVLLAYRRDGQPIPLRLVVPGDRHGGRSVTDVVRIEVR